MFKGSLMNTIGVLYGTLGGDTRALEYYERALKVSVEMDDTVNMEMCVSNIGEVYFALNNYPRALEYLERGLQLEKEMGDSIGYGMSLNLIAGVLRKQGNFGRALDYSEHAMKIYKEFDFTEGIAHCFFSIGDTYKEQKNYSLALQYFNEGLEVNIGRDSSEFNVESLYRIGSIYVELGDYQKALGYCGESQKLASKFGMLSQQRNACECLYLAHRSLNNGKYALEYLEKIRALDDSLNTQETNNRLQRMEIKKQVLIDSIATAEKERLIELAHQEEVRKQNRIKNIAIVGALFILLIAAGLFSRWQSVRRSKVIIEKERDRSDTLLLNILPEDIAKELKDKGRADARDFDLVSILFTDFKGFTAASEKLSAQELVGEINTCFEAFDGMTGKYKIEKIKTIGDAYMAAGGLPIPTNDSVKNTVLAALEMQKFITNRKMDLDAKEKPTFEMRVGVHTGPVVAGIVGVKKFQYDLWGDTVNTASRLESNGEAGKVNISQATFELLKDDPDFTFEKRGKIAVKGKGEIDMYFVEKIVEEN
jgi:class 3 adenylate cyclase